MNVFESFLGGKAARWQKDHPEGMAQPQSNPMASVAASGSQGDLMEIAGSQLGLNEQQQADAIQKYLATGGAGLDPATTAWCAAFVNATLKQGGMEGTGSNMARSFMDWGQGVDEPARGDLAVFSRGDPNGPYGHVGFFEGYNPDGTIRVLGGNQGAQGSVSISNYSKDRLLGFRRGNPMTEVARS